MIMIRESIDIQIINTYYMTNQIKELSLEYLMNKYKENAVL